MATNELVLYGIELYQQNSQNQLEATKEVDQICVKSAGDIYVHDILIISDEKRINNI